MNTIEDLPEICGIPNPKTNDQCVDDAGHEKVNLWHEDGAGKTWLGRPLQDELN